MILGWFYATFRIDAAGQLEMAEKKQHTVGKPEDFPVGKMKCLTVDGRNIGVVRMKSGELKAKIGRAHV